MQLSSSEQVVLTTLAYCDQFDFPLTVNEVTLRTPFRKWRAPADVKKVLDDLTQKKLIQKSDGEGKSKESFFCLYNRTQVFEQRKKRQRIAQEKWQEVVNFIDTVHAIPWIKAIFVTGSFAMKNSEVDDDVDFLLVTAPETLWLTRICVTFLAFLKGRRRSWQGEEKRSWCLNLWLDDEHLAMVSSQRNLYTAYEVAQAYPVFNRHHTVDLFYEQNTWIKDFLPNWQLPQQNPQQRKVNSSQNQSNGSFVHWLDWLAWKVQLFYMRPHRTSEKVGRGFAFFHPRDTRGMIWKKWQQSLNPFGISLPADTIKADEDNHRA
jgi:hypothetical protein